MTPSKQALIQFFLDNQNRNVPFRELQAFMQKSIPDVDRTTVYRNIEKFIALELIQELDLPRIGKVYQYIYDKKVHHFYICKFCGKANRGNQELFNKIENALKDIHGFSKANLSVLFYGSCTKCSKAALGKSHREEVRAN
ncbi:MAG: Fur family transcriptional regulator [Pseudobdellovibrionaceae bacterium]